MIFGWFSWVDFLLANVVWCIIMLWNSIGKSFVNFLAIFWQFFSGGAGKILSFVLCIYLYLIYIIGRSSSGSSSCSSQIAFSAT